MRRRRFASNPDYKPAGYTDLFIEIGCPAPPTLRALGGETPTVTEQSRFTSFIFVAPKELLDKERFARPFPRVTAQEVTCEGDSCQEATKGVYLTLDELRNPELLTQALTVAIWLRLLEEDQQCFVETGQCISGRFLTFWQTNGGLPVFRLPITPARNEYNADTGKQYLTQWFERNSFEYHPETPAPYDVLLGRLGVRQLERRQRKWQNFDPGKQKHDCLWFPQTKHTVCNQAGKVGFKPDPCGVGRHSLEAHAL